jgi:hypothetical protein
MAIEIERAYLAGSQVRFRNLQMELAAKAD